MDYPPSNQPSIQIQVVIQGDFQPLAAVFDLLPQNTKDVLQKFTTELATTGKIESSFAEFKGDGLWTVQLADQWNVATSFYLQAPLRTLPRDQDPEFFKRPDRDPKTKRVLKVPELMPRENQLYLHKIDDYVQTQFDEAQQKGISDVLTDVYAGHPSPHYTVSSTGFTIWIEIPDLKVKLKAEWRDET